MAVRSDVYGNCLYVINNGSTCSVLFLSTTRLHAEPLFIALAQLYIDIIPESLVPNFHTDPIEAARPYSIFLLGWGTRLEHYLMALILYRTVKAKVKFQLIY